LQCVAVCGSVLQCAAVCCSVLQCVAVCWRRYSSVNTGFSKRLLCQRKTEREVTDGILGRSVYIRKEEKDSYIYKRRRKWTCFVKDGTLGRSIHIGIEEKDSYIYNKRRVYRRGGVCI